MEKEKVFRTRNYATIVYKESAPENWKEILSDEHVGVLISPYHDKDLNPDGEVKKAHWHVLILFDGVKSQRQAEEFIRKIWRRRLQKSKLFKRLRSLSLSFG